MENTLLCTIDLSTSSRHTVAWAVTMARQLNMHLTILYTYRLIPVNPGESMHLKRTIEASAQQKFALIEKEFLKGAGISYDFRIEIGFVSDRIDDHARKNNMSFLVIDKNMGVNSQEIFKELLQHIQVPTLVIP